MQHNTSITYLDLQYESGSSDSTVQGNIQKLVKANLSRCLATEGPLEVNPLTLKLSFLDHRSTPLGGGGTSESLLTQMLAL